MPVPIRKGAKLEDPGAELIGRATELWYRFGRIALIAVGVLVVGGAVALLTARSRAASEEQAAGRLAEANVLYWQGEYERSLEIAKQIAQQYPSTPSGVDAHRLAGDNAFWDGDYAAAIAEYRTYLDRNKEGVVADAVRRSLAYALESDGQVAEAAAAYEGLVGTFDRESSAEFLAAAARCHRAAGRPDAARERLQRLIDEFGETSHANAARIELAELSAETP